MNRILGTVAVVMLVVVAISSATSRLCLVLLSPIRTQRMLDSTIILLSILAQIYCLIQPQIQRGNRATGDATLPNACASDERTRPSPSASAPAKGDSARNAWTSCNAATAISAATRYASKFRRSRRRYRGGRTRTSSTRTRIRVFPSRNQSPPVLCSL